MKMLPRVIIVGAVCCACTISPVQAYTITIPAGQSAIANHLDQGGNTLAEVLPTVPSGTKIYKWNCFGYDVYTKGSLGWSPAGGTLAPGEGAYIFNTAASPFDVTLSGQPHDPAIPLPLPCAPALSFVSAQTVGATNFDTIVGEPPNEGAEVRRWNPNTQNADLVYTFESGSWVPSEPIVNVGESVWIAQAPPPPAALSVSPTTLSPSCPEGENAPDQSFEVWNSGGGSLSYTITETNGWLSCTPTNGISDGEHDWITVSYTTDGLAAGTYNGTMTVTADGASGSPQQVEVTLTVEQVLVLSVSPITLSPSCAEGENAPGQSFEVWNTGGGSLSYTITETNDWLSCTPLDGTSSGEHDSITIGYTTAGLALGTYTGTITVTAAGANGSPREVAVTLRVLASEPVLAVSPTTLQAMHIQGASGGSASFEVWNNGGGTLSYMVSDDADWLDCSPTSGDSTGEHDGIVVFYHGSGLEVGKYEGIITVTAAGAAGSPQTVLVEELVTPRPRLGHKRKAAKKRMSLHWKGGVGIHLEKTSSLENPDWSAVPESEGVSELEVPTEDSEEYYRVVITEQVIFITQQPAGVAVAQGDPALLSVEAISLMPLSYQWLLHGTNLLGGTNETLAFPNVQPVHVGDYLAVVSNSAGSITSSPAAVVITPPLRDLVRIPTNTFVMGSPASEIDRDADEGPETIVTLTQGFWISPYEVTQQEYAGLMGVNPSHFTGDLSRPVESLSWGDATNYCATLTLLERAAGRIPASHKYRLPTEAEWESACRAGTTTRFSHGDDPGYTNLTTYAWYSDNGSNTTHPVGQKAANSRGLYDMHGNVWEWCLDWYASYPGGSVTNPAVDSLTGTLPVVRGGSYNDGGGAARSADRGAVDPPTGMRWDVGLRVVLAPIQP